MAANLYESELTRFLRQLRESKPQLAEEQRKGRAQWWDRSLDAEEQRAFAQSRVMQKPYVYQGGQ